MTPLETAKAALQSCVVTMICSCSPRGNPDVDDAGEIAATIEQARKALALLDAPEAVKVPEGWRLVPIQFVSHVLALEHNWTKLTPMPPEYCCGPDSEHWFKEAYRRCGNDLANAKAMLAAAPQPPTSGWLPIETAPRDGDYFLASGWNYGKKHSERHYCIAQFVDGEFVEMSEWNPASKLLYLDVWKPIDSVPPQPPTEKL